MQYLVVSPHSLRAAAILSPYVVMAIHCVLFKEATSLSGEGDTFVLLEKNLPISYFAFQSPSPGFEDLRRGLQIFRTRLELRT